MRSIARFVLYGGVATMMVGFAACAGNYESVGINIFSVGVMIAFVGLFLMVIAKMFSED